MKHRITIDLEVTTDGDQLTIAGDHKIDPVPALPHPAVDLMHHLVGAIRGFMLERGEELRVKSNAETLREDGDWVEVGKAPKKTVAIPAGFQIYKGGKQDND